MPAIATVEIGVLIAAYYAAFDNRGARTPRAADLRGLFLDGARGASRS